jgi:hypothetical protein
MRSAILRPYPALDKALNMSVKSPVAVDNYSNAPGEHGPARTRCTPEKS